MPINTELKEYKVNLPKWNLVEWFVDEDIENLPKVLRKIDSNDRSIENIERNSEYKDGAVLINVTKRTHDGMVGAVFRKEPELELSGSIDYLENDVNGTGLSLIQFSKKVLSKTMQKGRDGILVDVQPDENAEATKEETKGKKAKLIQYTADQIINWRIDNGKLSLVVLKECYQEDIDGFAVKDIPQYRELRLVDGVYVQTLWREITGETNKSEMQKVSEFIVKDYNGNTFDNITFTFVGTINNDASIDPSLLYSIAAINKGHYRNSADLEENCFVHGQLTLGITTSLDTDTWNEMNPKGVKVGARKGHFLGDNGGFHSVQALPNQLADALMDRKEKQMLAIGARLIQQGGGNEREQAVLARVGAETATLSSLAHNVSSAIEQSLDWADMYMSSSPQENRFALNQDFYPKSFDAQQIMALIQLYDRGRIAAPDLHLNLQQASIIADDRDLEDIEAESEAINPLQSTVAAIDSE